MAANVDTSNALDEFEQLLSDGGEPGRCREAIAVLRRWQWDRELDEGSRSRAVLLVRQFGRRYRIA
jgi:hypothetical protein